MENVLLYFALKYKGNFRDIYKAIREKERINHSLFDDMKRDLRCQYTTIVSEDYPAKLKDINCPPFVLFYYGDLSLLNEKIIAVIGTREYSQYGKDVTKDIVNQLVKQNYCTIAGLSIGIDTLVHEETIKYNGKSIAILGCGIENCYPKCNQSLYDEMKNNHLIISEYPFDTKPQKEQFIMRNRLISALCNQLIVTECKTKSSTMITVGYAIEYDKDIFCVPSPVFSKYQGTNELIQNGAKLLVNIDDLREE